MDWLKSILQSLPLEKISDILGEIVIWWSQMVKGVPPADLPTYAYLGGVIVVLTLWILVARMLPKPLGGMSWMVLFAVLLAPGTALSDPSTFAPASISVVYAVMMKDIAGAVNNTLPILVVLVVGLFVGFVWQLIRGAFESSLDKARLRSAEDTTANMQLAGGNYMAEKPDLVKPAAKPLPARAPVMGSLASKMPVVMTKANAAKLHFAQVIVPKMNAIKTNAIKMYTTQVDNIKNSKVKNNSTQTDTKTVIKSPVNPSPQDTGSKSTSPKAVVLKKIGSKTIDSKGTDLKSTDSKNAGLKQVTSKNIVPIETSLKKYNSLKKDSNVKSEVKAPDVKAPVERKKIEGFYSKKAIKEPIVTVDKDSKDKK